MYIVSELADLQVHYATLLWVFGRLQKAHYATSRFKMASFRAIKWRRYINVALLKQLLLIKHNFCCRKLNKTKARNVDL